VPHGHCRAAHATHRRFALIFDDERSAALARATEHKL